MSQADDLTPEELTLLQFESAKTNLVDQMVLYGIDRDQARIQVEGVVTWAFRAKEVTDAVQRRAAGFEVGSSEEEKGR